MPPADEQWILDARRALGDRVRVQRMHVGITQERLAEQTGIDRSTIQRIEYGGEAKISHLLLIARELRVHVRDLLG
ncbi:helix-turn-helix domain-containing protein [Streptomyces sp. NBC_00338]|uniref:helix-turn-helix domain-containing protein n=2 Tax=unclassified Streptomyces TaxID=2593676 RepID=UPI0011CE76E2|nr:helix-turn-helix transcriptional regulator [Streptomyces sp. NBC_00338]MCX5144655.1 helix-turn-helix domain-containing protein [Streptomyces sp. NBC_00338]MCX5145049.1 helix-turn-helix domain-containing protein [Streptomyces sp. NBC_00338]TXS44946.1 XRE family transcriptional regulator [Streptomyces sp. or43]